MLGQQEEVKSGKKGLPNGTEETPSRHISQPPAVACRACLCRSQSWRLPADAALLHTPRAPQLQIQEEPANIRSSFWKRGSEKQTSTPSATHPGRWQARNKDSEGGRRGLLGADWGARHCKRCEHPVFPTKGSRVAGASTSQLRKWRFR